MTSTMPVSPSQLRELSGTTAFNVFLTTGIGPCNVSRRGYSPLVHNRYLVQHSGRALGAVGLLEAAGLCMCCDTFVGHASACSLLCLLLRSQNSTNQKRN